MKSFKLKLILCVIVIMIASFVFQALFIAPRNRDIHLRQAVKNQVKIASIINKNFDIFFHQAIKKIEEVALFLQDRYSNLDETVLLADRFSMLFSYYFVVSEEGRFLSYPSRPSFKNMYIPKQNMKWVKDTVKANKTIFLDIIATPMIHELVTGFATPIHSPTGEIIGILRGVIITSKSNTLSELINNIEYDKNVTIYLVTSNGKAITHPRIKMTYDNFKECDISYLDPVREVINGKNGVIFYAHDNKNFLAAYSPIPSTGWGVIVEKSINDTLFDYYNEIKSNFIFILSVLVITGCFLIIAFEWLLKPLYILIDSIKTNQVDNIKIKSKDEIGKLAENFRKVYTDIKLAQADLERKVKERTIEIQCTNDWLIKEVEQRKKAETALKQALNDLEIINEELNEYDHFVSHDLKAPLRAIQSYVDFLNEDLYDTLNDDHKTYLKNISKSVLQAKTLIDNLLELSTITNYQIKLVPVNTSEIIDDLTESLKLDNNIEFIIKPNLPVIKTEPLLFRQIFQNLITNAIKFNDKAIKRVEIGYNNIDRKHTFSVKDNGIGIAQRHQKQIFKVFERLHRQDEYEGTGIGLAIVKKALTRLAATIDLKSEEGQGTTFFVTFIG